jgi:lipopolysaccharide/colanic/teichoic acid biosynthesis glycosyltransferase
MDGPLVVTSEDPRVTAVGTCLRRWSVDELPQFLNVIRGDMSLVGPRPLPEVDLLRDGVDNDWLVTRHQVRPGITGAWQVAGRRDAGFDQMKVLDREYVDGRSLGGDVLLLLKTIPAVLLGSGAR